MRAERFHIYDQQEWQVIEKSLDLSKRQTEILRLVFQAKSDVEIANQLAIAVPTLRTHLTRLYRKLDVSNRLELVLRVVAKFREETA